MDWAYNTTKGLVFGYHSCTFIKQREALSEKLMLLAMSFLDFKVVQLIIYRLSLNRCPVLPYAGKAHAGNFRPKRIRKQGLLFDIVSENAVGLNINACHSWIHFNHIRLN
jgi:hypothetical protein